MEKVGAKIILAAFLFLVAGLVSLLADSGGKLKLPVIITSLPIKYVRVEGVFQHLGKDELRTALEPLVTTGFFEADMQEIDQVVSALPWVDTVSVKRVWPDTIALKISEKKPFARWGETGLITEQGVIFTPKSIDSFKNLVILKGPEQQQAKVLEIMKGIKTALADQSMALSEFSINERWAWTIKLTNGLEIILGREEQLKKLQRFLKTLAILKPEHIAAMTIVDLRYPNGYAVSWRPEAEPIDWASIYETGSPNPVTEQEEHIKKH